ncbi:MAG TPA: sigma-70 family RNA polymerase sigma factor [Chloroflexota bacterium]|nr:sigma-70 family RNA polymerase sigma factor [Chloroflexota bacterium]
MPSEVLPDVIARARRGDRAAFGELYDVYLPRAYAFCRKYSASREEAEDLTAETFEKALAAIDRYEDRGLPFSAWLLRIAANSIIDRARRTQASPLRDDDLARLHDDSFLAEWEEAYWLLEHLATLPEDHQQVVRLRFYEDQPFTEVARRMGRSEGAVKQLLRRALRLLRGSIGGEDEPDHG